MIGCVHHWLIGTPDGSATVPAVCKLCGTERAFRAGEELPAWVGYRKAGDGDRIAARIREFIGDGR